MFAGRRCPNGALAAAISAQTTTGPWGGGVRVPIGGKHEAADNDYLHRHSPGSRPGENSPNNPFTRRPSHRLPLARLSESGAKSGPCDQPD
ncbi:hypothetical protein chiPu_0018532 [Chiloscyllium punctatum]|uniref:Uncharacterized protein n=1 Tax=Chiloscyllium punctatum TaxID=137246 RepID=A0A401RNX1_CHIPU|nr:hypothetical protein [Chiloscyllium punctatum]